MQRSSISACEGSCTASALTGRFTLTNVQQGFVGMPDRQRVISSR